MEQIFEILASMAGLIIYWLLTTRKNKQKKVKRKPEEVNAPERRREREFEPMEEEFPEIDYEEEQREPEPEPYSSFEEILQEFTQPRRKRIPTPEPVEEPKDFRNEMEEIKRKQREFKEKEELARQSIKKYGQGFRLEDDDEHTNILTSPPKHRFDKFKIRKRKRAKIVEMLQDPEGIRNAFIAKEVFDRKYFDY
ncbi:hypothetical protein [Flexithrix dorotheae]|uniref:hypothetical protein n=1 Tax=Flexithrix dorotheae TaxID=70993 RepID=UPI000361E1AF|nr:hypothetical protein [Flexithrix dorotheae]|eukprot:TRINITY_DN30198_c0_g4_i1.p3 TRINITY_DN30198_c0_g4~~TRINITY_DN30198_c0_g4_i1.p3  ORF type:complete len:195 (-),score=41.81 TRINITY_DN30198_c0_g4_i1:69-653(-)